MEIEQTAADIDETVLINTLNERFQQAGYRPLPDYTVDGERYSCFLEPGHFSMDSLSKYLLRRVQATLSHIRVEKPFLMQVVMGISGCRSLEDGTRVVEFLMIVFE